MRWSLGLLLADLGGGVVLGCGVFSAPHPVRCDRADAKTGVVARARPDAAAPGFVVHWPGDFDAAGRSFVFLGESGFQRLDVASGAITPLFPREDQSGVTMSPDGKTIYTTFTIARVRRLLITNFDTRPRLPRRGR